MSAQFSPDPFWSQLERFGAATALICGQLEVSYDELAQRADAWAHEVQNDLDATVDRPLVLMEAANSIESVAAYLGAMRAGWPAILTEPNATRKSDDLTSRYGVNVVVGAASGATVTTYCNPCQLDLHSDLRVLLSTSGTTGATKLVRLSQQNLSANCDAITGYLGLVPSDRAVTSLPWFYSYGLSVLHTTLAAGGALVLTDHSLVEDEFWATARTANVTLLPLVPTQFEILENRGFSFEDLPLLRAVTQAGGKLDADRAQTFATAARNAGVEFFVMYGQTEAAPRMSYLPSDAPLTAMDTIGVPVAGGGFEILDDRSQQVRSPGQSGRLIYTGPNVMMGYATEPADFAKGQGSDRLETGDVASWTEDGFVKIVGRAARFVKLNGLRIGLDEVEDQLRSTGLAARVTGSDNGIAVFVQRRDDLVGLRNRLARSLKIQASQITVTCLAEFPTLPSGKIDYRGLAKMSADAPKIEKRGTDLHDVLIAALRTEEPDLSRSFRDHGGDSLSYLEVELALGAKGIPAPENWDDMPLHQLLALRPAPTRKEKLTQAVPLDVLLRILAIFAIVANHATTWAVGGGAYFLLVLSGYSIARFQSQNLFNGAVVKAILGTVLKALALYYALLLAIHIAWKPVGWHWWALVGNYDATSNNFTKVGFYWYISAFAQIVALMCVPFFFRPARQWISKNPFPAGCVALFCVTAVFELVGIYNISADGRLRHTIGALELAMVGWCLFFAKSQLHKHAMTLVVLAILGVHWIDASPTVLAFIALGSISLTYGFRLWVPVQTARIFAFLGAQTLMIYFIHPVVLSGVQRIGFTDTAPPWSNAELFAATLVVSVLAATVCTAIIAKAEKPILVFIMRQLSVARARMRRDFVRLD